MIPQAGEIAKNQQQHQHQLQDQFLDDQSRVEIPEIKKLRDEFDTLLLDDLQKEELADGQRKQRLTELLLEKTPDNIVSQLELSALDDPIRVINNKTAEQCKMSCPRCHRWDALGPLCVSFGQRPTRDEMRECVFQYFDPAELTIDEPKRELFDAIIERFDPMIVAPLPPKNIILLAGDSGVGKTYVTHMLSLLISQYYIRDSRGKIDYQRGDGILEFDCLVVSSLSEERAYEWVFTSTAAFAQKHDRGMVVFDDLQLCTREILDKVLLPLFRLQVDSSGHIYHRGITFVVTMNMGYVGVTHVMRYHELRSAISQRVIADFGPHFEKMMDIFPFESWDTRSITWGLKRMLDQIPCRYPGLVGKISYTKHALDFMVDEAARLGLTNGRKVKKYFEDFLGNQILGKVFKFKNIRNVQEAIERRKGRGASWYSRFFKRTHVVVQLTFLPQLEDEPVVRFYEENF